MGPSEERAAFERRVAALRPKLHRYCARMVGSAIDGEDVVQEALVKALLAFDASAPDAAREEGWLFRIAHNAALDALRRRARAEHGAEGLEAIVDPASLNEVAMVIPTSLRTFMRLPVSQRSAVILMDVLEYSLEEIGETMALSLPAVKSALFRGRTRLRELAAEGEDEAAAVPAMAEETRRRLAAYVDRFNAQDFDAVRNMLAEEVRLELVNRSRAEGREKVGHYFHNYSERPTWKWVLGTVDGRPAMLCHDAARPGSGWLHFALLEWKGESVALIRDFIHAAYVLESALVAPSEDTP